MIDIATAKEYYQALINSDSNYEGIFYVGVKTTGVFCRPTCAARKPKFKNCEFYLNAKQALLASYRPCKRCKPLFHPNQVSPLIQRLINEIEANPEKRWKDRDFKELNIDSSTIRRQFKKRFNMTFVEYARSKRMGIAMRQIRQGEKVINAQITTGYESSSGFRDAFARIMGAAPSNSYSNNILKASWLDTPLGPMIAIADEELLYLLEFVDRKGLELEVEKLRKRMKLAIIPGSTKPISQIEDELKNYFSGSLKEFKTPLFLLGSDFQKNVWQELKKIPYGKTIAYADLATNIKKPTSYRAAANANGKNQLCIIIPCHRVIRNNGDLGGYGSGIVRKKWLLEHEKQFR